MVGMGRIGGGENSMLFSQSWQGSMSVRGKSGCRSLLQARETISSCSQRGCGCQNCCLASASRGCSTFTAGDAVFVEMWMTALFRDEPDCLVREDLWDVFQVMLSWRRCEWHSLDVRDSLSITPLQLYIEPFALVLKFYTCWTRHSRVHVLVLLATCPS